MKTSSLPRFVSLLAFCGLTAPLLAGCPKAPDPKPVPPIPKTLPTPKFDPAEFVPGGGVAQGKFEVAEIRSGDLLLMRTYLEPTPPPTPKPIPKAIPGAPTPTPTLPPTPVPIRQGDPMRLAGIVAPQKGQPGYEASIAGVAGWTTGKALEVELDPRFPTDVDDNRMVLVKFPANPKGEWKDKTLLLNRMMVRAGWAVVDLYTPTIFDTKDWLKDEAYARENRRGLWGMGIAIQQRVPIGTAPAPGVGQGKNKLSNVKLQAPSRPGSKPNQTGGIPPAANAPKPSTPAIIPTPGAKPRTP